ncbi:hypothetical protein GCM10010129_74420 [Streptomyces fumigatiscleroticus]|nr:hypothetical protein GCM10010129_74420 [Streptomyces fumigatiscleroticus]
MSENTVATTELTAHYIAQVAGDLERNAKEQERLGAEIAALQEQLRKLENEHTVLHSLQQALGVTAAPAVPAAAETPADAAPEVPAPRKETAASGTGRRTRAKKAAGTARATKKTGKSGAKKEAAAPEAGARPTLVELIRRHLAGQNEPRSAAEISTTLGQAHPERTIKTNVVRTTLEGLVAKGQAQRSKQGTSVFYTASDAAQQTEQAPAEEQSESAGQ